MSDEAPGARAAGVFELEDVFLVCGESWVVRDHNPTMPYPEFSFAQQTSVANEGIVQKREPVGGGETINIVRYFVSADVRILKPGVMTKDREPTEEEYLAKLKATVAVDYRCPTAMVGDSDAISAFARNAHYHAWPYLREEIQDACGRLRVPRVVLPALRPEKPVAIAPQGAPPKRGSGS